MLRILPLDILGKKINKKGKKEIPKKNNKESFSILSREKKCPECNSKVSKNSDGEMYCQKCGFVILLKI